MVVKGVLEPQLGPRHAEGPSPTFGGAEVFTYLHKVRDLMRAGLGVSKDGSLRRHNRVH